LGQEIHESVLGDRDLVTERLLTQGGMAGLFGGAASAAFPLTGALLTRGGKVPAKATAEVLAKATDGQVDNVMPVAEMLGSAVQGKPLSPTMQILGEMKTAPQLVNEVAHDLEGVTQRSAAVAKKATEDMAQTVRSVVKKTEDSRIDDMRGLFAKADDEVVPGVVLGEMESLMKRLDDDGYSILNSYEHGYLDISKRHLDTAKQELQRAWDDIVEKGSSAADAHTRLLGVKRRMREIAKDAGMSDSRAKATSKVLRDMERQIGDRLGAAEFGKAGEAYLERAQADALALQASEELFQVDKRTGLRKGKNLMGRVLNGEATDADILTFTKRVGDPKYADQAAAADDYFQRQIKAAEVRAKHSADPSLAREVELLKKGYQDFQRTMGQQAKVADIADAFRAVGRGANPGFLAIFGPSGATVAGAVLGGVPGAMIGGVLNAMARPGSTLRTISAVASLADKAGLDVDGIVSRALALDVKGATRAATGASGQGSRRAAQAAGRTASRGRGVASRGAAQMSVSQRNERQRERAKRASELADPDVLTKELARQMYALADAAPGVAGAAAEKIGVAAAFLQSKLPPEVSDPITGSKRIIDPDTRDSFDRYYEAVTEPIEAIRRLETGTMTLEHAEALRECWPALFADVQEKTLAKLQEAADEGVEIPYSRRKSLGVLLGIPTTPEMSPEYIVAAASLDPGGSAAENAADEAQQVAKETAAPRIRKTSFDSTRGYQTSLARIERHEA
jgi:hypothetical protein